MFVGNNIAGTSRLQAAWKERPHSARATLPFGVYQAGSNRFFASLKRGGQTNFLGSFDSAQQASSAARTHVEERGAVITERVVLSQCM